MNLKRKLLINKHNHQMSITIPKKRFKFVKDKLPSYIRIKIEGWE